MAFGDSRHHGASSMQLQALRLRQGVRKPTEMSLVKWSPPTGMEAVCATAPSRKAIMSVGARPDVHQARAEFALFRPQHGIGAARGSKTVSSTWIPARLAASPRFACARGSGHDMYPDFQFVPIMPSGSRISLSIENEFLGQQVEDFAVVRHGDGAGLFHCLTNFVASDFPRTRTQRRPAQAVHAANGEPPNPTIARSMGAPIPFSASSTAR